MSAINKPTCLHCGKPLRRFSNRNEPYWKDKKMEWGDYGDGAFCGLRCGYRYGVEAARVLTTRDILL